jgi:hypothetical protein
MFKKIKNKFQYKKKLRRLLLVLVMIIYYIQENYQKIVIFKHLTIVIYQDHQKTQIFLKVEIQIALKFLKLIKPILGQ